MPLSAWRIVVRLAAMSPFFPVRSPHIWWWKAGSTSRRHKCIRRSTISAFGLHGHCILLLAQGQVPEFPTDHIRYHHVGNLVYRCIFSSPLHHRCYIRSRMCRIRYFPLRESIPEMEHFRTIHQPVYAIYFIKQIKGEFSFPLFIYDSC